MIELATADNPWP